MKVYKLPEEVLKYSVTIKDESQYVYIRDLRIEKIQTT